MPITETQRFEMQVELRKVLGETVANTLMEHLPPSGWADVARKSDLEWFQKYVDEKFNHVENRIGGIITGLWAMSAIFTTAFIGLFTVMFTKF